MIIQTDHVTVILPYNPVEDLMQAQMMLNETEKHRKIDSVIKAIHNDKHIRKLPSFEE